MIRGLVARDLGLILTGLGGIAGVLVSGGLLGDKGLGGAAVIAAALGASAGLLVAVRTGRAQDR